MHAEDVVMLCISDFAGQVRGKGFPATELASRLTSGIGLAPTNLMITALGEIGDSPWGPRGEVVMLPDPATETRVQLGEGIPDERLFLADLVTLDGCPWACCPRGWLARGLDALESEFGLRLNAAFEHEFHYSGAVGRTGDAYLLDALRLQGPFAGMVFTALRDNGIEPETFLPEFGPGQFEVTVKPKIGVAAADDAVRLREIVRAVARGLGQRARFAPVMAPGTVGNGVHVHFSLQTVDGEPVSYDPDHPDGMSKVMGAFAEGVLETMPELTALSAPSPVSYERLKPNRWSAAWNNLGRADREEGVRICPVPAFGGIEPAASFNLEYRAADAAASPYMLLGALVWAGLEGVRRGLRPRPATTEDPASLGPTERVRYRIERLPTSLNQALDVLEDSGTLGRAMGPELHGAYLTHKRAEVALTAGLTLEQVVERYVDAY